MGICGCGDRCTCSITSSNTNLVITGSGDSTDPWILTASGGPTFAATTNADNLVSITPGGPSGHEPIINLIPCNIFDPDDVAARRLLVQGSGDCLPDQLEPSPGTDYAVMGDGAGGAQWTFNPPGGGVDNDTAAQQQPPGLILIAGTGALVNLSAAGALATDFETDTTVLDSTAFNITVNTTGFYHIIGYTLWDNASNVGSRVVDVRLNGALIIASDIRSASTAPNGVAHHADTMWPLTAGDFLELLVAQDSGVGVNVSDSRLQAMRMI